MKRVFLLSVLLAACASRAAAPGHPAPQRAAAPAPTVSARPVVPPPIDAAAIADQSATRGYSLGTPRVVELLPDGDVLFLRTGPRSYVAELFELDVASGQIRKLASAAELLAAEEVTLSPAEKARRERTRTTIRGIVGVQASDDGNTLLVPLGGQVFLLDRSSGKSRSVPLGDGYPDDPRLSPDGTRVGFLRDGELWVADVSGGPPRRLTRKDGPDVSNGAAEFVAQEELERTRGYWWSPDGAQLVYQRTDESKVDKLFVANPFRPEQAPTPFHYPRAGTSNADVRLGVTSARAGGKTVWIDWDRTAFPYVRDVQWPKQAPLTLVVMNRAQTEARVLAVEPKSGKTSVLVSESDPAWVNVADGPRWLADGKQFLWASDRSGQWQLELRAADGALLKTLDVPGFDGGVQLDEDSGEVWLNASADPTESQVARVELSTGKSTQVTEGPGVNELRVAKKGGTRVAMRSGADGERSWTVLRKDGKALPLPSVAEDAPRLPNVTLETVTIEARVHHAAIVRPRDFDPKRRYPVILQVYAGPHVTTVWNNPRRYFKDQLVADTGFIVVRSDNRGTPRRGRAWERIISRDLITIPLADQVAVLKALGVRHPELDQSRVGVMGWSFGGYFSAMAALLRPDVFKAAVAGAPVTDWRSYDTAYTERFMGLPSENAAAYDATSAVKLAPRLTRPLLLIHGVTDDNVYVANTLALSEALLRAGKPHELLLLGSTHMMADPAAESALLTREIEFFRQHLGLPTVE